MSTTSDEPNGSHQNEGKKHNEETSHEQDKKKMTVDRSLISVPYSTQKSILGRIRSLVLATLKERRFKPADDVAEDFKKVEPYLMTPLTLDAIDRFDFQFEDMEIRIRLTRDPSESCVDMSLPATEILGELNSSEIGLTVHLRSKVPSAASSVVNDLNTMKLKVIKLHVSEPDENAEGSI